MVYDRQTRDRHFGDYYGRPNSQDYGRDFDYRSDQPRSSARDYAAAGEYDPRGGRHAEGARDRDGGYYGGRQPEGRYARQDRPQDQHPGSDREYHGSYASDGRRFEDVGRYRDADDDNRQRGGNYGRQTRDHDHDDRGFIARAGDEVRSWFGDDDAERRREADARYDDHAGSRASHDGGDGHYHGWRRSQIAAFDRDYEEYRHENRSKFESEFAAWRTERQGQRDALSNVQEHMEVVGSDGAHVGTVDKVRGDRILLTKNDKDAGGVHHSIPSRWIRTVDDKVTLAKSADEAKAAWQDEERNSAQANYGDRTGGDRDDSGLTKGRTLGKSFSGTY